jgi:hypothetical protein
MGPKAKLAPTLKLEPHTLSPNSFTITPESWIINEKN